MAKEEYIDKKIIFKENAGRHADFKIACEYEGITQGKFFRLMLRKMIEKDKRILGLIDEWKKENNKTTIRRQTLIEEDRKKKEEFEEEFGMSEEEIKNLYELFDETT